MGMEIGEQPLIPSRIEKIKSGVSPAGGRDMDLEPGPDSP